MFPSVALRLDATERKLRYKTVSVACVPGMQHV